MVSIFPPNYSIAPIFNVPDSAIVDIIKNGHSELFYNKAKKLLDKYKYSLGIDEEDIPFIKNIKRRCTNINIREDKNIIYTDEIDKAIDFLEEIVSKKERYFIDYIEKGRELKKINKNLYIQHKTTSITYTPFGIFGDRTNSSFIKSSNLLYFDIDIKITKVEKEKLINFFTEEEFIKTAWYSFSGEGFGFTVESDWKDEAEMKKNYYKLVEYFTLKLNQMYGFNKRVFDTQVCSLSRMNFISNGLICNKKKNRIFTTKEYSDELFNLIHTYYKKDSLKELPNKFLTEDSIIKQVFVPKQKIDITNDQFYYFLDNVTKKINFSGSTDFNGAIKNYVSTVFRYDIDESIIENYLFNKIPYNRGTEQNYRRLISCYSGYSSYRTQKPYIYN